jgi:hypothetical protein
MLELYKDWDSLFSMRENQPFFLQYASQPIDAISLYQERLNEVYFDGLNTFAQYVRFIKRLRFHILEDRKSNIDFFKTHTNLLSSFA